MWAAAVFPSITTVFTGIRQPLFSLLAGPHPRSLSLGGAATRRFPPAPRSGRRRFSLLAGPHPRSLSLGGAATRRFPPTPRSGRRRFSLLAGPHPRSLALRRSKTRYPRAGRRRSMRYARTANRDG